MKVMLILALACIAGATAFQKASDYNGLKRQILSNIYTAGARSDVIDLADPLNLNDTTLNLDASIFRGVVSLVGGIVTGGSNLVDDIAVNLLTLKLTITLDLSTGRIVGAYTIAGEAVGQDGVSHVVSGTGGVDATINGFKLTATGTLRVNIITNKASIVNLDTQRLSFDSVALGATGALVDGIPVDWDAVNADAKNEFDRVYAEKKDEILDEIEAAVNEILGEYTLAELIDLITGKP